MLERNEFLSRQTDQWSNFTLLLVRSVVNYWGLACAVLAPQCRKQVSYFLRTAQQGWHPYIAKESNRVKRVPQKQPRDRNVSFASIFGSETRKVLLFLSVDFRLGSFSASSNYKVQGRYRARSIWQIQIVTWSHHIGHFAAPSVLFFPLRPASCPAALFPNVVLQAEKEYLLPDSLFTQ